MARKTKYDYYDDTFKATAVELGELPGVHAKDVAEVLDIHPIILYRWKKEYREGVIMKKSKQKRGQSPLRECPEKGSKPFTGMLSSVGWAGFPCLREA
ncbi:MAG TPA: hypothetical protein ENJ80_00360 [Gammaproteobacteria bacterium]|nr:hypothetical protein [Gammaproteobacteria bacterium]